MHKCQTCGQTIEQSFCTNCGEKRFYPEDLNFNTIFKNFFLHLIDFDFKVFRSFKVFIAMPSKLALNYINGVRIDYLKPYKFY